MYGASKLNFNIYKIIKIDFRKIKINLKTYFEEKKAYTHQLTYLTERQQ